jgi:hypothetical protein
MRTVVKIFLLVLFVAIFSAIFLATTARAQSTSPRMVITWQAYGSYVPPQYGDKALPSQESRLTATVELLINGKSVDLSGQTIYWYLNNTLIDTGVGDQYIVFSPFGTAPAFLTLEAELPSFNGTLLVHEIQIPLVSPKAVIEAPHPSGEFSGNPITLQGTPYFFYTSDPGTLSYAWSVDGQTSASAENPQTLQIDLDPSTPSVSSLSVSLIITNPADSFSGNDSTNVVYVKQL